MQINTLLDGQHSKHQSRSASREDFQAVAKLISLDPPDWLAEFLKSWSSSVLLGREVERRQPTRAQMRSHLRQIGQAAAFLLDAVNNPFVRDYLSPRNDPMGSPSKVQSALIELRARADRAFSSPALTNSKGKTKAGRGPAMPDGAISAQSYCALLIAEAWKAIRGEYPKPRNKEAAEAIDHYWKLAGGEKDPWGNDPLVFWRYHLKKVGKMAAETERAEIRRHLGYYQGGAGPFQTPAAGK